MRYLWWRGLLIMVATSLFLTLLEWTVGRYVPHKIEGHKFRITLIIPVLITAVSLFLVLIEIHANSRLWVLAIILALALPLLYVSLSYTIMIKDNIVVETIGFWTIRMPCENIEMISRGALGVNVRDKYGQSLIISELIVGHKAFVTYLRERIKQNASL